MTDTQAGGSRFEIRVRGHLGPEWSDWFQGLEMSLYENGEMMLSGHIADQAALLGILIRLNHLNLALLSVCSPEEKSKEVQNGQHSSQEQQS